MGAIILPVTEKDLDALEPILDSGLFEKPELKISIYKNRRGKFKGIYLWCKSDLGVCKIDPMFATKWDYDLVKINNTNTNVM